MPNPSSQHPRPNAESGARGPRVESETADIGLVRRAARAIAGVVRRTPLVRFPSGDERVELWLKLECLQVTGAFKARGAGFHLSQLDAAERGRGVVAVSSGNHAKAVAWAARRAGTEALVCMPRDAYPAKIEAARRYGAEVYLGADRDAAEVRAAEVAAAGRAFVPPYDHARTIAGQGTCALEIFDSAPELDAILVPVGGGGLLAGVGLVAEARRRAGLGRAQVIGVEPSGARGMGLALEHGAPQRLDAIRSSVQGLTPPAAGTLNTVLAQRTVASMHALDDAQILSAQARIVRAAGWSLEPAGAAAAALVFERALPAELLAAVRPGQPLRVAAVLSGGNPDVRQIAEVRERARG